MSYLSDLLSRIAKILERHANAQCLSYLESHSFISDDQSAFLKYRSTITALHKVDDYWLEAKKTIKDQVWKKEVIVLNVS